MNKNNPMCGITLKQLDGIFSKNCKCRGHEITQWGQLADGPLSGKPIKLFGRKKLSVTYAVFENIALCGGDFNNRITELEDSRAVITAVENDIGAIGYAGPGYRSAGIKPISVGRNPYGPYYPLLCRKNSGMPPIPGNAASMWSSD